jgi:hypothetical protein
MHRLRQSPAPDGNPVWQENLLLPLIIISNKKPLRTLLSTARKLELSQRPPLTIRTVRAQI